MADPGYVNRIATILQSGSVMDTRFRLYETHLNYVLQFLSDFGLYGCGVIELEDALERCADARDGEDDEPSSSGGSNTVKFAPSSYFRESRVPLEVDAIAPHILNRHRLSARNIHHKLQIPAPQLPSEPLVLSVRELWDDERKRRQDLGLNPSPEIPIDPSESSRGKGGEWVAEARWWDEIAKRIEREREGDQPMDAGKQEWERFVMTTFESVEAIWEKQHKTWKPAMKSSEISEEPSREAEGIGYSWEGKSNEVNAKDEQVEVDISKLSDKDISQLVQEESQGEFRQEEVERPPDDGHETDLEDNDAHEEVGEVDGAGEEDVVRAER